MVDTTEIKQSLQRELDALSKARDELKLQLTLAKKEAIDEWSRLENTFERLQSEVKRIGVDAKEPLKDIGSAARHLLEELKRGYSRVKTDAKQGLKDAAD